MNTVEYTLDTETFQALADEIQTLKKEKNAVILAHYYQHPEVQDVADFVGDSLQLSQQAAQTDAEVIIFCGVHFMAESAAILSPEKIVVLPEERAGCPMADMVDAESLRAKKQEMPGVQVVCYVNSSAAVKAESDICCTSSNALKIVESLPPGEILFVPDANLGNYIAQKTGRHLELWPGHCNTHHKLRKTDIDKAKAAHPEALVIVHPECREEVWRAADFVGSTAALIKFAQKSDHKEFIVGTEYGIMHELHKTCPDKQFYLASQGLVCPNMKSTSLRKVRDALVNLAPRITVAEDIRLKAKQALDRMLELSK